MRLSVDEMRVLHCLRGEEFAGWSKAVLWLQSWFDFLTVDVWARRCDLAIIGGDPVCWTLVLDQLAKQGEPASVAIVEPGRFQGAPLSALREESFRADLMKQGVKLPDKGSSLSWFYGAAIRAERSGLQIMHSTSRMSAAPVPGGVMLLAAGRDGITSEGSVALEPKQDGRRGASFFEDSARLNGAFREQFWRAFSGVTSFVPERRRYGNLIIARKVLLFSMSEGHFQEAIDCPDEKILRFDFSEGPLATISQALEAWSADMVAASRLETRLDQTGEKIC